jgi:hypothetical protein
MGTIEYKNRCDCQKGEERCVECQWDSTKTAPIRVKICDSFIIKLTMEAVRKEIHQLQEKSNS